MDQERPETMLARRLGVPYDLDSFYMPLVSTQAVIDSAVHKQHIIPPEQFRWDVISEFCDSLMPYYDMTLKRHDEVKAMGLGLGYGEPENYIYNAVIKAHNPDLIIEIGCGISTWYARNATNKRIICVEPFPKPNFSEWCSQNNVELWQMQLQEAVESLPFDGRVLLFVDSTHVAKITSELHLPFTKILPKLGSGALVHFHDIFLPFPCLRPEHNAFAQTVNWYESVLLGVYLQASDQWETVLPQYWMGIHDYGRTVLRSIPFYQFGRGEGSSYWIRKR